MQRRRCCCKKYIHTLNDAADLSTLTAAFWTNSEHERKQDVLNELFGHFLEILTMNFDIEACFSKQSLV